MQRTAGSPASLKRSTSSLKQHCATDSRSARFDRLPKAQGIEAEGIFKMSIRETIEDILIETVDGPATVVPFNGHSRRRETLIEKWQSPEYVMRQAARKAGAIGPEQADAEAKASENLLRCALLKPTEWEGVPVPPRRWLALNRIPIGEVTGFGGDGGM